MILGLFLKPGKRSRLRLKAIGLACSKWYSLLASSVTALAVALCPSPNLD
jgi:hypothetical protein